MPADTLEKAEMDNGFDDKSSSFLGEQNRGEYLELGSAGASKENEHSETELLASGATPDSAKSSFTLKRRLGLIVGSLIFTFMLLFFRIDDEKFNQVPQMLACLLLMITFWVTELVNPSTTSMLPLVLFPILGISSGGEIAKAYMSDLSVLFIAAFTMAAALELVNLHRRIALNLVKLFGTKPVGLLFGFMLPAWGLSLFMSNSGTTALMLPLAQGVIDSTLATTKSVEERKNIEQFGKGLMLGVAYSTTIGGTGTLVATPPNGVLMQLTLGTYGYQITFGNWVGAFGLMTFSLLLCCVGVIYFFFGRTIRTRLSSVIIDEEIKKLGNITRDEKVVAICFIVALFSVVLLAQIIDPYHGKCSACSLALVEQTYGNSTALGSDAKDFCATVTDAYACTAIAGHWSGFMGTGTYFLLATTPLYVIPSKVQRGKPLLPWKFAISKIPWSVILLIGGGLAVSKGFKVTHASSYIADFVRPLGALEPFYAVLLIIGIVSFLTEITSNTATTSILVPIMFKVADENKRHPLLYGFAVSMGACMAFMLPIATGPNAVLYATGKFKGFFGFAKPGFVMNTCGIVLSTIAVFTTANLIFGLTDTEHIDPKFKKFWL